MSSLESLLSQSTTKGPPKDVSASELVRKLMSSKRPSEVLPFPRTDSEGKPLFEYQMMVLSQEELDGCLARAEQYTRKLLKQRQESNEDIKDVRREAWSEIYENAKCVELLFEAMRDKDDLTKRVCVLSSELRQLLTVDELTLLFRTYEAVQFRYGPMWRLMTNEEVDAWVARIVEGADSYPLEHLGLGALIQLVNSLAFRLHYSKIDTGSYGSDFASGMIETSPQVNSEE